MATRDILATGERLLRWNAQAETVVFYALNQLESDIIFSLDVLSQKEFGDH